MFIRPVSGLQGARHEQSLPRRRDLHAFRHHGRECRAVTIALQQRLHSRKGVFETSALLRFVDGPPGLKRHWEQP